MVFNVRDVLLKHAWFEMYFNGDAVSIGNTSFYFYEPLEFGYTLRIIENSWSTGSKIAIASNLYRVGNHNLVLVFHDGYGSFTTVTVKIKVSTSPGKITGVVFIGCMIALGAFVGVLSISYVVRPRETKAFLNKVFGRYRIIEKLSKKFEKPRINILEEDKVAPSEPERSDTSEPDKTKKDKTETKSNKL